MRLISEVRVFTRFTSAPSFMKYAGRIPSEHSSGDRVRRGKITKAGNSHIRYVLVEAVQRAHVSPRPSKMLALRSQCGSQPADRSMMNRRKTAPLPTPLDRPVISEGARPVKVE